MKSLVRGAKTALALTALATPLAGTGCESNNQSLFIVGALAPADGTCIYTPGSNLFLLSPTLDVALGNTYTAFFEVRSQLVSREDYQNVRAEPNRFVATGAEVRLTDGIGGELSAFTSLASGTPVQPESGGGGLGGAVVPVSVVDPKTAVRLAGEMKFRERRQLVAFVKVFGQTLGNKAIESSEYQFVVNVCKQCLVEFPSDARDTSLPTNNCNRPRTVVPPPVMRCGIGQDTPIDCRDCAAANSLCQPPP